MTIDRRKWMHHAEEVIRSRHYTWLPQGLGGEPVEVAMTYLLTDIMHVCKLAETSFEDVLQASRRKFHEEELQAAGKARS